MLKNFKRQKKGFALKIPATNDDTTRRKQEGKRDAQRDIKHRQKLLLDAHQEEKSKYAGGEKQKNDAGNVRIQ